MILLLVVTSIVSFVIIQLPPGDFLTTYIAALKTRGEQVDLTTIERLKHNYGLGQPIYVQYWRWVSKWPHGNFGQSFQYQRPVGELIAQRLGLTVLISVIAMVFTYIVAVPIGVYSATHHYSAGDYLFTFIGFIGLTVPPFLLALVLMYMYLKYFGVSPGGLFSVKYLDQPWSWAKFFDMLKHLPLPVIIVAMGGTAGIIRVMRATMLDEVQKPYVFTARAKGLPERRVLYRYAVRMAINPLASTIGWIFPAIISGETITAIVLNLPTSGPMLLGALLSQDMYLAGTMVMFLTALTIVGMFVSDILLAWLDPRIRYSD